MEPRQSSKTVEPTATNEAKGLPEAATTKDGLSSIKEGTNPSLENTQHQNIVTATFGGDQKFFPGSTTPHGSKSMVIEDNGEDIDDGGDDQEPVTAGSDYRENVVNFI